MALLPTKYDLGNVLPTATRPIAVADTTAVGRGIAQMGQGLQAAGTDLDYLAKKKLHEENIVNDAQASAGYLQEREQKRLEITGDGDYATQTQRFQEANKALIDKYSGAIADPRARQIWVAHNQESSVAAQSAVEIGASAGIKQTRGVLLDGNLQKYQSIIADPRTDDVTRKQATDNLNATIDAGRNEGLWTPDQAQKAKETFDRGGRVQLVATQVETKAGNAAVMPPPAGSVAVTGIPTGTDVSKLPAGMKNNNPGNLKFTGAPNQKADYPGIVGPSQNTDQGSPQIVFRSAEDGMTAMGNLALKKFDGGANTVRKIIAGAGGWTPAVDEAGKPIPGSLGNPAAERVAKLMGVSADAPVNFRDPKQLQSFMRQLVRQEQGDVGGQYPDALVAKGATRALSGERPGDGTTPIEHPAPGPGGPHANFANVQNMGDPRTPGWEQQNLTTIQAGNGQSWQVNKKAAEAFQGFLKDLEAEGYNPKSSGGYNYRTIRGGGQLSQHAFGTAIDIGAAENPMGTGPLKTDLPANVSELARKHGLVWGGDWTNRKDPMHFEWAGDGSAGGAAPQAQDPYLYTYGKIRDQNPDFSPQQVEALTQRAISANSRFKVEDRASLEGVVQDAPAAIQTTGGYSGNLPTRQQFADAYGVEGQKKYDTFQAAIGVSKTVHDMLTMPAAQIQATVDASRAANSGEGAALDLKKSEAIQSAAASTLKSRKEDPASYTTQAFPNVGNAVRAIDGTPEKYAEAFRQMAAAQTHLGIPPDQQALVTKDVAENVVKASKDETKTPDARLAAITQLVTATPDRGQRQTIFDQLVKAGLPPQMEGVMEAAAAGRTGAAQRLFVAANLKAGDLPGTLSAKDSDIEKQIQSDVMADGQIGDAIYGLSAGSLDNTQHLANDAPLLKNDVKLYLSQGVDLATATQRAAHDLYGDLQVINEGQVKAAAPLNIDKNMLIDGLALQKASVGEQMSRYGLVNEAKTPEEKQIARFAGMDKERHIQSILDNGTWRSVGGGYGLLDPATGLFVAGADGKPFVVKQEDALAASGTAFAVPPSPSGVVETPNGPARRDGKPAVVPSPTDYRIFQQRREVDQRQRKMGTTPSPIGADIPAAGAQPAGLDFTDPSIPK